MGLLDHLRRRTPGLRVRCGMCGVATDYPLAKRDRFVRHTCDADLLVREREPSREHEALDLFMRAAGGGPTSDEERVAARDHLLYEQGEGAIPGLEDLLYRLKYSSEPFPPEEIASRRHPSCDRPSIDYSNELEMYLHRMKKFAITRRLVDEAPATARPILLDKLERLKQEPLEPIEG